MTKIPDTSVRGKYLKTIRGYAIREWSGPWVESGRIKPFSAGPSGSFEWHGFGSLAEAEAYCETAPTLVIARVNIEAYVPDTSATREQIEEWVRFSLHETSDLSVNNPLSEHEFVAHDVTVTNVRAWGH